MTPLAAFFLLGLAGGVHCVAMCGPLMAGWRQQGGGPGSLALYHAGRLSLYALFGLLAGSAGHAVAAGGLGRALSIGAGIVLVAMAIGRAGAPLPRLGAGMARHVGRALGAVQKARASHQVIGAMAAGALNGLLPCGLVYAALTGAAGLARPVESAAAMLAFGLGTTPLLAGVWWSSGAVRAWARARVRYAAPLALAATGGLLILRGLATPHIHVISAAPAAATEPAVADQRHVHGSHPN